MGFGIRPSVDTTIGQLNELAQEPAPSDALATLPTEAIAGIGGDGVDGIEPAGETPPRRISGFDDLQHATLDELKDADIPALMEDVKQRLADLDIDLRDISPADVDTLPIPDWAKEAVKFLLNPEGWIENKKNELKQQIDDAIPGWAKDVMAVVYRGGEIMRDVSIEAKRIFSSFGDAVDDAKSKIGKMGQAIGNKLADAGRTIAGWFGF